MNVIKIWIKDHPTAWEFILFNVLSNCATVTNFIVMWICTGFVFRAFSSQPFQFLIFNYTNVESDLGLCGFLSFLIATALAQTVNFCAEESCIQIKCGIWKSSTEIYYAGNLISYCIGCPSGIQPGVFCEHWNRTGSGSHTGKCSEYCGAGSHQLSNNEILGNA